MLLNRYRPYILLFLGIIPNKLILRLLLAIVLVCGAAICNIVAPILLKQIVDILSKNPNLNKISELFIFFSLILILGKILGEAKFVAYAKWEQALIKNGFNFVYNHIQYNAPYFYKSHLPGTITSRIFQAIFGLKVLLFDSFLNMLPLLLEFLLILTSVSVLFSNQMMLTIGVSTILYAVILIKMNNKLLNSQNDIRNATINAQGLSTDLISNWKDIKLTNGYELTRKFFHNTIDIMTEKNFTFYKKRSLFGVFQSLPLCFMFIYSNFQAITAYFSGVGTIGSLVLINSYLWLLLKPLESFGILFRNLSRSYTDFTSIDLILSAKQENIIPKVITQENYHLNVKNVNYKNILVNISFDLNEAEKIAIIGASGSGKTTLLNILSGLEMSYTGEIFFNNAEIRTLPKNQLRKDITLLASDSRLITGSIKDNLLLGNNSKISKIEKALTYACIENKITSLPSGIEEKICEDSTLLSSGEKQRIKIARTFLLNGKIKIFDESTSALDLILEEQIVNNILADKNSVIFITHRLSFLPKFDRIFVMQNGKITESGSHDELIKHKKEYYSIWNNQNRYNSLLTTN